MLCADQHESAHPADWLWQRVQQFLVEACTGPYVGGLRHRRVPSMLVQSRMGSGLAVGCLSIQVDCAEQNDCCQSAGHSGAADPPRSPRAVPTFELHVRGI